MLFWRLNVSNYLLFLSRPRAGTVIGLAANISALVSILLAPFMPEVSETMQKQMNIQCNQLPDSDRFVCILSKGHQIGKVSLCLHLSHIFMVCFSFNLTNTLNPLSPLRCSRSWSKRTLTLFESASAVPRLMVNN